MIRQTRSALLCFSLGILASFATAAQAQNRLELMVLPGPYETNAGSQPGTMTSPQTFTLPEYGLVTVSWAPIGSSSLPDEAQSTHPILDNRATSPSPFYNWGANVRLLNFNPLTVRRQYRLTFTFESGQPNLAHLHLLTYNLGYRQEVGSGTTVTPSQPLVMRGNYVDTASPRPVMLTSGVIQPNVLPGTNAVNTGVGIFGFANGGGTLPLVGGKPTLTLDVNQIPVDQIALTLAHRRMARVKLCKVAGDGVAVGTVVNFTVTVAGVAQTIAVPAGPAPGGWCRMLPQAYLEGSDARVVEQVPGGASVSEILVASPITPVADAVEGMNRAIGLVDLRLMGLTEITYTNVREIKPDALGYIEICKTGGAAGTASFNVTGRAVPIVAPVGGCSPATRIAVATNGEAVVTEAGPANPIGCSTYPANRFISWNQTTSECRVRVTQGAVSDQTVVFFVNR